MLDAYVTALGMVLDPYVLFVITASAIYGLVVGCIPGLSATMATALLVPLTFFMPPVPAIAAIVTTSTMAIFSGDIPGCLLRIPGTPASAAYVEDSYKMTQRGEPELALGIGLWFSVLGGLFGTAVMMAAAPAIADFALGFGSVEFFWIVMLGLGGAVFIGSSTPLKACIALLLGLMIAMVGMNNPAGQPRFTFDSTEMLGGVSLIPMMVGMFACSEVMRHMIADGSAPQIKIKKIGPIFANMWRLTKQYPVQLLRGSALGTVVGIQPGSGADMAAWMSYAMSKRFSKEPEKFGTGHPEGLIEAGASNNSSLAGAWIPALVFGIPGDSITAIAIGVLMMKNMAPGPTIFVSNPQNVYALFLVFVIANLMMLPLGWAIIKVASKVLTVPRKVLMPIILVFAILGSYAINNSLFDVGLMLAFGVLAFVMEENGFPVAPVILGVVLGPLLEEYFINSMIKSDGSLLGLVDRPIAAVLATVTIGIVAWTILASVRGGRRREVTAQDL
ncbi:tripartite tricarboxylate transporter permease [Bosea sp. (in: a-proteobacteria)]|jgi:TctA family transporter|uniref:tripartite tricarboxylate transporter permease n=1 Tax=Bosea sp. (in: a-proteobacteria) TaxID=1871050 RepID=UPI00086F16BE|nr:tripartite tricarboxylate transporter permease [Bosea sp. (in: a-proteobacteria)]MBN9440245.1 tripartite tricarboxylate transporter permease [Bosea sp. (in: a-proteobacteria)]MBN9449217.1 tripartite tricarboxylate transporter permease [Bosea sp. (in: a-proteobacteria)]MBN9470877.1 tripartite tricarboxylate transporter permease [Bosea sp. (in: a-proteobacteria)]ODT46952.1 MAG: C4-dicarboxylate ABC transporter permease [Methylobacterium sp. SCN 67-24]